MEVADPPIIAVVLRVAGQDTTVFATRVVIDPATVWLLGCHEHQVEPHEMSCPASAFISARVLGGGDHAGAADNTIEW